ncbi:uncharacterized protein B0H64DRAFT_85858 [Chaetomium fimeti]|uniref:BZIP domain-containing protein n=1 Tax=Chaetomium fimeti TaxID=1854472 RepID=A0AAE0HMI4_9PEZI|nr:hypothetical protein B0H64DRAFT_85858 [Chaetomium fimeti]
MDVFRFFRPSGEPKEDRAGKRRAQVRRAQQTYRLRKDQYTKSLENEVSRLRAVETDLLHETRHLHDTIQTLGNLLADRGVDVNLHVPTAPASDGRQTWPNTPLAGNHLLTEQPQGPQGAQLGAPRVLPADDASSFWPEFWQDPRSVNGSVVSPEYQTPSPNGRQVVAIPAVPNHHKPQHDDTDTTTTMGMEFVLALEAPCLPHLHGDPSNPSQPCGHALTVSSQLLAISPAAATHPGHGHGHGHGPHPQSSWPDLSSSPPSPPSPPSPKTMHDACAKTPASILDRLLTLSAGLDVAADEVTPVRAWHRVRGLPGFEGLGREGVRVLMGKLGAVVKCHGFGAVVKEAVFENLLREVFTERRKRI